MTKGYEGELEYVGETCATCAAYYQTPHSERQFKNYCRGYVPAATAQNQWAYWPHVQSNQPACALWRRHPDLVTTQAQALVLLDVDKPDGPVVLIEDKTHDC